VVAWPDWCRGGAAEARRAGEGAAVASGRDAAGAARGRARCGTAATRGRAARHGCRQGRVAWRGCRARERGWLCAAQGIAREGGTAGGRKGSGAEKDGGAAGGRNGCGTVGVKWAGAGFFGEDAAQLRKTEQPCLGRVKK
jgi:hypothetical protein